LHLNDVFMARYFMELAYNGSHFCGWQIQPNGISVQGLVVEALSTILRVKTSVTGAGRTDAGVHARYMVAHFDVQQPLQSPTDLARHLSRFLPTEIEVFSVIPVADNAHSRFDAIARRYEYHVTIGKNPFTRGLATRLNYIPDFEAMNKAAELLVGYHDFTSFSKLHGNAKTNFCDVTRAYWEQRGDRWVFTIEANRFLRNMVRAVVGTLLEVGRGKLDINGFNKVIERKYRGAAGTSVAAEGLYLVDVVYPTGIFQPGHIRFNES
jgi:tRNA pseudouridine38-40 synthase